MLSRDISRCTGNGSVACVGCLRMQPGHPTHQWHIVPVAKDDECMNRLTEEDLSVADVAEIWANRRKS